MKRMLILLLALLCLCGCAAAETEKYDAMPEIYAGPVEASARALDEGSAYVCKE